MKALKVVFVLPAVFFSCQSFADQLLGQVIGWGENISGEATGIVPTYPMINGERIISDNGCSTGAVTIAGSVLTNIIAISADDSFSLALKTDSTVIGWGDNEKGRAIGKNTPNPYLTNGLVTIGGQVLTNVISIAAGESFGLGLKRDGTVVAWGGQPSIEAVMSLPAIKSNDEINEEARAAGIDPATGPPLRLSDVDPVTGLPIATNKTVRDIVPLPHQPGPKMGDEIKNGLGIGIKDDGTVMTWMPNHEPTPLSNVVAIAAHQFTSLALKSDGTVVGWSSTPWLPMRSQMYSIAGLSNVVAITVGGGLHNGGSIVRCMAIKRDGTVFTWGNQNATPPTSLSNVVAIAAGYDHSLALEKNGTVFGWGSNKDGQAAGVPTTNAPYVSSGLVTIKGQVLSNIVAVVAGQQYSLALKGDGTVVAWGDQRSYNGVPAGLSDVIAIAAGDDYCLAITTNSAVAVNFRQLNSTRQP